MNETQARAAMRKLWGTKAAWRYNEKALRGDEREAAGAEAEKAAAAYQTATAARDARRAELLKDPEYLRLCEVARTAEKAHTHALSDWRARRVTVGYIGGVLGAFHVVAEGDNWQEAIDAARAKGGRP